MERKTGIYVNPDTSKFERSLASEHYVDKSNLIAELNRVFFTDQCYVCVSRPRRFGKTMAANMLAAYYGSGICAKEIFDNLDIAKHESYEKHLNEHIVVKINMKDFLSESKADDAVLTIKTLIKNLEHEIRIELEEQYPDVNYKRATSFTRLFNLVRIQTGKLFVILIDEWDCVFREYKYDEKVWEDYLDFLRLWLKDQAYIGLAYMTGILPIKKYGTHSALNMFDEMSMIAPRNYITYFGFTMEEVEELQKESNLSFEDIKYWYNGYFIEKGTPIFNPRAVVAAVKSNQLGPYWTETETYEALRDYIVLNMDDLQDKVTQLIAGENIVIDPKRFQNDMSTFETSDDVLTLLVHLGYLNYNFETSTVRIPNEEIKGEFITSIETSSDWSHVMNAVKASDKLLYAIWSDEAESVAQGIQKVHEANTSILEYNDENSLAMVINLALYTANKYYTIIREMPTGKGYADLVYIPRKKHADKPAMVVELKWDKKAAGAITQIKSKNYPHGLEEYKDNLLLVGINYDKESKTYECIIEKS